MKGPGFTPVQRILARGVRALVRPLFPVRVVGAENLPAEGPFVVAVNHASLLDGFLVLLHLDRPVAAVVTAGLMRPPLKWLLQWFRAVPVVRGKGCGGTESLVAALSDCSLLIFPEGGRSADGSLRGPRTGVGVLALACQVPVVPVGLCGTFDALPKGRVLPRRVPITLRIGKPLRFGLPLTPEHAAQVATEVMADIGDLLSLGHPQAADEQHLVGRRLADEEQR